MITPQTKLRSLKRRMDLALEMMVAAQMVGETREVERYSGRYHALMSRYVMLKSKYDTQDKNGNT